MKVSTIISKKNIFLSSSRKKIENNKILINFLKNILKEIEQNHLDSKKQVHLFDDGYHDIKGTFTTIVNKSIAWVNTKQYNKIKRWVLLKFCFSIKHSRDGNKNSYFLKIRSKRRVSIKLSRLIYTLEYDTRQLEVDIEKINFEENIAPKTVRLI